MSIRRKYLAERLQRDTRLQPIIMKTVKKVNKRRVGLLNWTKARNLAFYDNCNW